MIEAINEALDIMLARDPDVVMLRRGCRLFRRRVPRDCRLAEKYGKNRVFDTPINECGIIGAAVGMARLWPAARARNPVRRLYLSRLDQLVSEAARLRYRSAGDFIAPITVRSPFGGGIFGGQTHSQSPRRCSPMSRASRR
ncbi:MAG: hypothetical protein LKM31_13465 [Sphingobium sp.]|jgi:2-oxoisovalerate dehydrogenase E1 component beta subunit|nr:hypothetical protein [Sphingobium sp.]